jgi:hypothetical protein
LEASLIRSNTVAKIVVNATILLGAVIYGILSRDDEDEYCMNI